MLNRRREDVQHSSDAGSENSIMGVREENEEGGTVDSTQARLERRLDDLETEVGKLRMFQRRIVQKVGSLSVMCKRVREIDPIVEELKELRHLASLPVMAQDEHIDGVTTSPVVTPDRQVRRGKKADGPVTPVLRDGRSDLVLQDD